MKCGSNLSQLLLLSDLKRFLQFQEEAGNKYVVHHVSPQQDLHFLKSADDAIHAAVAN